MAKNGKRKASKSVDADVDMNISKRNKSTNGAKKPVKLNNLKWKTVELQGQLDDYEGFYGLEEVDNVEIVREGETISFRTEEVHDEDVDMNSEDHESWNGFSDTEDKMEEEETDLNNDDDENYDEKEKAGDDVIQNSYGEISFKHLDEVDLGEEEDDEINGKMKHWKALELSSDVLNALESLNFLNPTPIQTSSIPRIIDGRDVIAKAETGSGKTLAFGIPILESFNNTQHQHKGAWALILSPTRELAHQIGHHLEAITEKLINDSPKIAIVTGGLSVQKQERQLSTSDIIIATPGRLNDVLNSGNQDILHRLKAIKYLVLDEADRLLGGPRIFGEYPEMETLILALNRSDDKIKKPRKRQTLMFSATFDRVLSIAFGHNKFHQITSRRYEETALEWLKNNFEFQDEPGPEWIDVNESNRLAKGISEGLVECGNMEKDLYLYSVLSLHPRTRTLVFLNSIAAVRRVTPFLQNLNLPAQSLHSSMVQKARLKAIEKFTKNDSSILISTDVAARGLDIPGVELVVHYHLPRTAEMYVHRSGRTARAENQGSSILLCSPEEIGDFKRLMGKVHEQGNMGKNKPPIQMIDVDKKIVQRLKPRSTLAKKIADVGLAKEKTNSEDQFFKQAAEELGVDYDSEELEASGGGKRGRGNDRKKKERANKYISKEQVSSWKRELQHMLSQKINVGVSEKYLAQGIINVESILRGENKFFFGNHTGIDLVNS